MSRPEVQVRAFLATRQRRGESAQALAAAYLGGRHHRDLLEVVVRHACDRPRGSADGGRDFRRDFRRGGGTSADGRHFRTPPASPGSASESHGAPGRRQVPAEEVAGIRGGGGGREGQVRAGRPGSGARGAPGPGGLGGLGGCLRGPGTAAPAPADAGLGNATRPNAPVTRRDGEAQAPPLPLPAGEAGPGPRPQARRGGAPAASPEGARVLPAGLPRPPPAVPAR